MYSEVLGGADSAKLTANHRLYRSHLHASEKAASDGHADGIQIEAGSNIYIIENVIEMLFRNANGAIWASGMFSKLTHHYYYGNLFSGGQNGVRLGTKNYGAGAPFVLKGNRFLGIGGETLNTGNVSWNNRGTANTTPLGGSAIGSISNASDNRRTDGAALSQLAQTPAPTSQHDANVQQKIIEMEDWVASVRDAVGYVGGGSGAPPQPTGPVAPTLLD
jgi:hypothetical protein